MVNKSDVVDCVAGTAGVAKQKAQSALEAFFDTGRNRRTDEAVAIPASRAVKFSASSGAQELAEPAGHHAWQGEGAAASTASAFGHGQRAAPAKKASTSAAASSTKKGPGRQGHQEALGKGES